MSTHQLPDFELDLGRATRWVRWAVRSILALAALLLAAGVLAYSCLDLGAVGRALLGGGG